MANRMVIADVAWSGCQAVPIRLSIAQEQMVTQSQYLTAAGELQQAFFPDNIDLIYSPGLHTLHAVKPCFFASLSDRPQSVGTTLF